MVQTFRYFAPTKEDSLALRQMAQLAFSETFAHLYEPAPFAEFLQAAYGEQGSMENALADPHVRWQVAAAQDQIIGYVKLSPLAAPAPAPQSGALELQQIYVLSPWHGKGVAEQLIVWALDAARALGAPEIYLTVFDHNHRAKRFYARHGFSEIGRCTFKLGDRVDDDRIWRRPL